MKDDTILMLIFVGLVMGLVILLIGGLFYLDYLTHQGKIKACEKIGYNDYYPLNGNDYCTRINLYSVEMKATNKWGFGVSFIAKEIKLYNYRGK